MIPDQLRFPEGVTKMMMPLTGTGMSEKELVLGGNDDCDVLNEK